METDKPSCMVAKNLLKAGLCLVIVFGGALAGASLVGMSPVASLKDSWSSAPLALENTDVLAGSSTGGVNSKALEGERQLISKVFAETPSKLFDWPTDAGESTDDTPTAWSSTLPTEENLKSDLWFDENHFVKSTKVNQDVSCQDVPNWMQPDEGVWRSTPFANMTCEALEVTVSDESQDKIDEWCEFLSQGVFSVPSANKACCFCDGGNKVEPECSNMVWNSMQSVGCDFI
ncbi:hypothetical protein THAOC_36271 [Thalassiosira oceanica]|uniref:Uncharacterized protein n=1 Tax=Thalassiosira oceanica TaxID=159749 RepID=K0R0G0_THAOC|nr:hypothetical protein THAOC_36271 [Thalassiosira oceanica]|eukprot:EJK45130.1 hypothetical protein THAOC_36271 [Thalassiosira oceanica]